MSVIQWQWQSQATQPQPGRPAMHHCRTRGERERKKREREALPSGPWQRARPDLELWPPIQTNHCSAVVLRGASAGARVIRHACSALCRATRIKHAPATLRWPPTQHTLPWTPWLAAATAGGRGPACAGRGAAVSPPRLCCVWRRLFRAFASPVLSVLGFQ